MSWLVYVLDGLCVLVTLSLIRDTYHAVKQARTVHEQRKVK